MTDSGTHADLGVAFDTGLGGIANLAWDGTNLWVTAYDGSPNAHLYLPNGTFVKDVNGFGNQRDGFEVAGNHLIANNGDAVGPYDLYDLNGNLITPGFIQPNIGNFGTTGITFDGMDYWVSDIFQNQIEKFDINGNYLATITLGGPPPQTGFGRLLEDLSSLGNIASNPPPGNEQPVPEPGTFLLVGTGLAGLSAWRRRTKI